MSCLTPVRTVDHLQSADQALLIDRTGRVTSQLTPKKVLLSEEYVAEIANSAVSPKLQPAEEAVDEEELSGDANVRRYGDISLYRFFFAAVQKWLLAVWALSVFISAATERFPRKDSFRLIRQHDCACNVNGSCQKFLFEYGYR